MYAGLRVDDIVRAGAVVADMRKIIRQDPRIIQKLHRRVFLDKITRDQVSIYISCYVDSPNRDAFMAVKQDLLLAFTDCVERNGARLARNRLQVQQSHPSCCLLDMSSAIITLACTVLSCNASGQGSNILMLRAVSVHAFASCVSSKVPVQFDLACFAPLRI